MTQPTTGEPTGPSALWLALRVFDEPSTVFQHLATRPRFWVPIALMVLTAVAGAYLTPESVFREQLRPRIEAAQRAGQLTEEQAQQQLENAGGSTTRIAALVAGAAGVPIMMAIIAGVLMLIFGAGGANPVPFKTEFAVVTHAYMVSLAGILLVVLLMRFAGMEQVGFSLSFLFDRDSGFPFRFAEQITLFGAWNVFLVALGNKIITKGKGLVGPLVIVGGLWLLLKVGMAALAGLGPGG